MERGAKKEGGREREEAREIGNGLDFLGRSCMEIPPTSNPFRRLRCLRTFPPRTSLCSAGTEMATSGTYGSRNIPWQQLAWLEFVSNLNKCLLKCLGIFTQSQSIQKCSIIIPHLKLFGFVLPADVDGTTGWARKEASNRMWGGGGARASDI